MGPTDTSLTDTMSSIGIFFGFLQGYFMYYKDDKMIKNGNWNGQIMSIMIKLVLFMPIILVIGELFEQITSFIFKYIARFLNINFYSSSELRRFERKMQRNKSNENKEDNQNNKNCQNNFL